MGIECGGTFTDAAFVDEHSGAVQIIRYQYACGSVQWFYWLPLSAGCSAVRCWGRGSTPGGHAATVATNALIEGKTATWGC